MRRLPVTLILLLIGIAPVAVAQPAPQGAPFSVTHFTAQEYRAQPQNWSVAQDQRGLIYVANNDGLLQYDGARWRLIETNANTFVRSVAADSQGTVYAGAVGDFGVLRPDSTGTLQYVSLAQRLPSGERDFEDVWNTHATDEGTYFQTRERLFRWDGDTLHSWKSEGGFHTSFVVRGQLYVRDMERGLLRMVGDSLQLAPGGERFADVAVYVMVPYGQGRTLIGTRKNDLLLYDGQEFTPFPTQVDPLLEEHRLYHGCMLSGGEVALATLGGGVLIIDREGRLVQVLNQDTALPDGVVNHVYPDGQGGLWMALHNQGVVRAEVSSPLSRFGERFGLEGIIYDLHRHAGALYAATGAGLYVLRQQGIGATTQHRFEKVPGVPATWSLLSAGNALFAATNLGVYRVQDESGTALVQQRTFSLAADEAGPDRLYVGTGEGLGLLQRNGDGWNFRLLVPTRSEVRSVIATDSGALWFSTLDGTVLHLPTTETVEPQSEDRSVHPRRFGPKDGLPSGKGIITDFQGAPVFVSKQSLYRTKRTATDTSFYADTTLTGLAGGDGMLRAFYEASTSGSAWLFYDDRVVVARRQPDGTYTHETPPSLQFPRGAIVRAQVDPSGSAWISNHDELIRYDASRAARLRDVSAEAAPRALIRQVRDAGTGTVIYGGAAQLDAPSDAPPDAPVEIPYRQNTLAVTFALPQYGGGTPPEYQYRLKGQDEKWSAWTPSASATFGDLHEGTYTFQVRARGKQEAPVEQASLTLRVLPPWYRTPWAYLSYLAAAALLTVGYRRYRHLKKESLRAQQQERELKRERKTRARLQEANDRLEEANRLKENFLANTSHEFRTPLASIMGYAEVLQTEDLPREQQREFLKTIRRSGDRLLNTVDMLLEIAQLRAGALNLKPSRVEVNEQIEQAVAPFRTEAADKGLEFQFAASQQPLHAQLPAAYFRRIVENLVDNAIKFTPEGAVHIAVKDDGKRMHVSVCDTGVGMEEQDTEQLFGEFKQASEGVSREYEGIGLGLTIAARLTHLMGGSIEVESKKGEGSTFSVCLPKEAAEEVSSDVEASPAT